MTILRTCTVLMLLGFAVPAALVWQTLPAHAEGGEGGGESDGSSEVDDVEEPTEEELRARRAAAAPATTPAAAPAPAPDTPVYDGQVLPNGQVIRGKDPDAVYDLGPCQSMECG